MVYKAHLNYILPEGQGLGFFDELLVGGVCLHSHHHGALLGVYLGVQLGIPTDKPVKNQVDIMIMLDLIRLTIHFSASSEDMLSFSASMEMEIHW